MSTERSLIINGSFKTEKEALISPINRGLMYGDGCFETLRWYEGRMLDFSDHYERLQRSCDYLGIELSITQEEVRMYIQELATINGLESSYGLIRLQLWRQGQRGYRADQMGMEWMLQLVPYQPNPAPLKLITAETRCIPSEALDRTVKLTNGLNYIKAAQEARRASADDALMLTVDDHLSETTIANIFWVNGQKVFTPSDDCDLLPGITRNRLIRLLNEEGIEVSEGVFELKDIKDAEAAFCTNSLMEIRKVAALNEKSFDTAHELLQIIEDVFQKYKTVHLQ